LTYSLSLSVGVAAAVVFGFSSQILIPLASWEFFLKLKEFGSPLTRNCICGAMLIGHPLTNLPL